MLHSSTPYLDYSGNSALNIDYSRNSSTYYKTSYEWQTLPNGEYSVGFIDTHCHLDFLFTKVSHNGTLEEYKTKMKSEDKLELMFPVSFEGCVAVFCQPNTFHKVSRY